MFTQNEEEWKKTNELGSSEYRRRITHEDICHCDDERQFALQSTSQDWEKSTDYCGGFSDYMTLSPLRLWLRNDLKRRNQQRRHSFKRCYRNLQRYRGSNHSEAIQNRRKHLDTTDHQFAKSSENLRTVRVIPMRFVSKLATKDSSDLEVDKASDSNNLPFDNNEFRKALDVPYYGPFRARKIIITPSMKFRNNGPMAFVSKLATKNSPNYQVDNATDNNVPININESRKASDVPYYGPFRARLLKLIPAIKTKKYRSVKEYYLSETEYLHEIPNGKCEINEHPIIAKETHDKSTDSRIVSNTYDNTISKHICSEYDEIPLFVPTISKIDDRTNSLSITPKIDDRTNSLSITPKIDDRTNSLSAIPKIDDQSNSSGLSSAKIIDEFELPKKSLENNLILKEKRHETGRDTLMEGLALLKHRKKEYDENLASNKKKQFEIVSKKNPEIRESLDGKMQQSGIKKIAAYWHKKTFKNNNQLEKYSQKSEPSQIDHNLYDKQCDKIISQTISQNVDNTTSIDISNKVNSGESKFVAEIRQIREGLRKISKNLEIITGDTNISKNEVISTDTEGKISPELLPSYSHEILTDYTIQPLVDSNDRKDAEFETIATPQISHISGKTENKDEEQDRSLENVTISVERITPAPEESSKKESSLYSGRKSETITAEVYIRNPKNLKPTVINISDSNKKPKKPCWMILKTYESPSSIFDDDISKQNFDRGIIRIRSDPTTLSKKFEKLEAENFSETTRNIPSAIIDISKMKQEASERIQTKTLITSDSELRSNLTVKTQIDTSIKSKIITSETIRRTDALSDDFQTLITMKTDEICKINHTIAFERFITTDNEPIEICRRGSSIFFIFQYNNDPQILNNLLILFKNELANYKITISAVKYNSSIEISKWSWHVTYKILTLNTALFEIVTPTNIPIGLWQMIVQYDETSNLCIKYLCILFNPWHKDDETYYRNEIELNEYILNELAMIRKWNQKDAWLLGQFSAICMNTILHLLELCLKNNLLKMNEFGSSFAIVKAIATAINKFILDVKWDDFQRCIDENEILPSAWTGSKEIMTTYRRMGSRIGYGQSWCYAGLLTSICRCIGIPCRIVTIYNFAPKIENGTLIRLDMINDMLAEKSKDTIWHYHIWNELWLQSKIFEKNESEWHICDATPTIKGYDELLGLFPVRRIKNDDEKAKRQNVDEYFGQQLYEMLNANIICNYYYRDSITHNPIFAYSKKLGKKISNKLIIATITDDIDVTMNYKQQTNLNSSLEESKRLSLLNEGERIGNVELNLNNFQNISIDKPINGYLSITNNSLTEQTINAQIQVDLTSYTGLVITHIYLIEKSLIIQPKQTNYFRDMFTEDWNISIMAFVKFLHTNERFYTEQVLTLLKPVLSIEKVPQEDSIAADEEQFQISMTNSTNISLTNCEIRIDGTGLRFHDSPILCGSIEAYKTLSVVTNAVKRTNLTERKIVAVLNCDQLKNVRTYFACN